MTHELKPDAPLVEDAREKYVFTLYIAGMTRRSRAAIESITRLCKDYLAGRYELEIVDLYREPGRAGAEQIVAAPTLMKTLPLPLRRLIGDMTDREKILIGLDIRLKY